MSSSAQPVARNYEVKSRRPQVQTVKNGTRISGHELIHTLDGSVLFTPYQIPINPGIATFTWLSQQAHGWEKYKFLKLEIVYVPSNAVTTTPGSVFIAADFDAEDPVPETLQALSTYEVQRSGRVYEATTLSVPGRRMNDVPGHKFIRDTPVAANLSLYDPCSICIATVDCADASPIGQIWINYEVELISPQTQARHPTAGGLAVLEGGAASQPAQGVYSFLSFPTPVMNGQTMEVPTNAEGTIFTPPKGIYEVAADFLTSTTVADTVKTVYSALIDGAAGREFRHLWPAVGSDESSSFFQQILQFDGTETFSLRAKVITALATGVQTLTPHRLIFKSLDR